MDSIVAKYHLMTHPADTVIETMLARKLTIQQTFGVYPSGLIHLFLMKRITIDSMLAAILEKNLGPSKQMWLNLSKAYEAEANKASDMLVQQRYKEQIEE